MNSFLQDNDGNLSSKRLVTIISLLLLAVSFIANLFWGFQIERFIFDGVMYITIAGLGISGAEKFAPSVPKS